MTSLGRLLRLIARAVTPRGDATLGALMMIFYECSAPTGRSGSPYRPA
jgi:hypothetical protein